MRALLFSLLALLVALSSAFYVPRDDLFYASSFEKRAKFYEYPRSDINTNNHDKREFNADDLTLRFGKRSNFVPEDLALRFGRK